MNHEKGLYFHDRDSLANAINVPAYYDLSTELIADEIFNNKENTYQVSATLADIIAEKPDFGADGRKTNYWPANREER
ncbi:hypothetical protein NYC66_004762 [Salmonella enterica]|nr:hypothetical protein [Salmonella enterica]